MAKKKVSDGGEKEPENAVTREGNGVVLQSITDEMRTSYLDYAMSVITARALPDVRDGLKPVHRTNPLLNASQWTHLNCTI